MKGGCDVCAEHSGIEARVGAVERDVKKHDRAIDGMRAWVIAGMGALIAQLVMVLLEKGSH